MTTTPDPSASALAQIGVTGLAVMGRNLARNLARHGYRWRCTTGPWARTESLVAEHGGEGTFLPSRDMAGFVASLATAPHGDRDGQGRRPDRCGDR